MKFSRLSAIAETVVADTQRRLPPDLRPHAAEVAVHCCAAPAEDLIREGFPPDILGLFSGAALDEDPGDNPVPPQIHLYLENLWDYAEGDPEFFREEVRVTYLHELGHYLGLDEGELEARGLE